MAGKSIPDGASARSERADGEPPRRSFTRYLPIAVVLAGLAIGYAMGWQRYLRLDTLIESRDTLKALVAANPLLAPLVFFAVYATAVALSFPAASILSIFGGFLFGWFFGSIVVALAATLGATLVFLAARSAIGDVLCRKAGGKAAALADGFESNAFGYLLALRLAPIFPFFLVNIAPALFNVRLRTFVTATAIGILPGVFAYCYLGAGLDDVLATAKAAGTSLRVKDLVTPEIKLAFAILALVALLPIAVKKWKARRIS